MAERAIVYSCARSMCAPLTSPATSSAESILRVDLISQNFQIFSPTALGRIRAVLANLDN